MLWRMPADTRTTRIGIMFVHFDGSTAARAPTPWPGSTLPFRRGRPVKTGSANCANCANPPSDVAPATPVARSGGPPLRRQPDREPVRADEDHLLPSRLHDDGDAPRHRAFEQRAHRLSGLVQPEGAVDMRPATPTPPP